MPSAWRIRARRLLPLLLLALPAASAGQQTLAAAPPAVSEAVARGDQALQQSHFQQAEAEFLTALATAPNLAQVRANLGLAYYAGHQYQQAAAAFQQALRQQPSLRTPRTFLPLSLAALGRCREAEAGLRQQFHTNPDLKLRRILGLSLQRCLESTGDQSALLAVTGELVQRYPNDADVLYESGRIYGQLSSALYLRILKGAPHSPRGYQLTGQVLASEGKWRQAIQSDRQALQLAPAMTGLHLQIATLLLTHSTDPDAWQEADKELRQELQVAPDSAPAEYELGEVWRKHGQLQPALQAFRHALDLEPALVDARLSLAKLLRQQHHPQQAVQVLEPALRDQPANPEVHFLLAQLYRDLGQSGPAQQEMRKFQQLQPARQ